MKNLNKTSDEESLMNLLTILSSLKVIDYWSVSRHKDDDKVKICGLVIRHKAYGQFDSFTLAYLKSKK
jgi:hypothetical protein